MKEVISYILEIIISPHKTIKKILNINNELIYKKSFISFFIFIIINIIISFLNIINYITYDDITQYYFYMISIIILIPSFGFVTIMLYSFFSYLLSKIFGSKKNFDSYFCLYCFLWIPFIVSLLISLLIKYIIPTSSYLMGTKILINFLTIMWFIFLSSIGIMELNNFSVKKSIFISFIISFPFFIGNTIISIFGF